MPVLVCFGDCLTAREVDDKGNERLTSRIRGALDEWIVINAGSTPTSREGVSRFQSDVLSYKPDYVTIFFGTQEACLGQGSDLSEFERNIEYMVKNLPSERVILISPSPVMNEGNFSMTNQKIEGYADRIKHLANKLGTRHIDLWKLIRENKKSKMLYEKDGLQLNAKGYKLITKEVLNLLGRRTKFKPVIKLF
ncbi:GDSL-type esterase/lipase family protein [Anaerobacillus sp. 1_MG-2023]|uniref:SGNH/GDSL hydrolase family protein n=1 Tax=Anaerobacillus sp. 1_MG-2023 TaxID=3062655 RepID=UPI0026E1946D|nr:GDSL-type esterase/lipase family protein [Anaerobacillus sp. 1_MG-2023]MDO6657566.1 GDSL-type esterase/lipase family protein [Anaerobacillus sp. 1_MG-2023]